MVLNNHGIINKKDYFLNRLFFDYSGPSHGGQWPIARLLTIIDKNVSPQICDYFLESSFNFKNTNISFNAEDASGKIFWKNSTNDYQNKCEKSGVTLYGVVVFDKHFPNTK